MRIPDLALLSDCRTAALADREGTIAWFSPGRFDAASIFGRLLDPGAGHWTIRPRGDAEPSRTYVGDGPILRTTFATAAGELELTDALALRAGTGGHGMEGLPATHLVRQARCTRGTVDIEVELAARPEYGLTLPHLEEVASGWLLSGGRETMHLVSTVPHRAEDATLRATHRLEAGEDASWILAAGEPDGRTAADALAATEEGWRSWQEAHDPIPGPSADAVRRSAMVLQALTYAPTGVVVAAPTTSLPERIGEDWNWDYRYAWLRDLSFVVHALWVAACPDEPVRYLDWIARALGAMDGDHVQIMFGVEGERDLTERTLDHLAGYRDSRPVRVGNDAWTQTQLDVLGEVVDSAHLMRDYLGDPVDAPVRDLLIGLADRAASRWRKPDFGMWEARDTERHYLSSKVMCWVAVDRAVRLADRIGADDRVATWSRARDEIREAVLHEGWNPEVRAFTGAFGSDHLDASVLLMPLVGIVDGDDERMVATLERIEERLATDAGVQRWADEGSAFILCGFWLSECLALAGQRERAEERFAATAASANDLGLLAEEVSMDGGEPLGNFPQALSHVGLINAAWRLATDEKGTTHP
jgi:GH15 family glucan-1,4-alpha-glucosidase